MSEKNRKKKSGGRYIIFGLLAVVCLLAVACGFFYAEDRSEKDVMDSKPGDKKEVSLLDESIEAQRQLDNILLQKDNWQLSENSHGTKDVDVAGSGAKVKINQRELAVGVPDSTSLTGAGQWLKEKTQAAGLEFISGDMSTYKTWDAYKAEIGIKTKAGEGTKSFVTDTVIIFHNSNLKKADKDVKDLPEEKKPEEKKEEPASRHFKGKLAVIIDDCGYDMAPVRSLLDTGLPFSYAILPYKTYSSDVLSLINSRGRVAMLHLPMEPMNSSAMSEGSSTVCVSQPASKKQELVRKAVNSLPGIMGVNNHQGSRATADKETMKTVLKVLKQKGLFFVDSRTIGTTVGRDTAKSMGVPTAKNDIFLDNSTDVEAIRAQIYKAMAMADRNGSAIAICHARPNTARCWQTYAEEFRKTGITFVPVTELLY